MGRLYTVTLASSEILTSETPMDVLELSAPADMVVAIHSIFLGQSSDAGDAEAEMLRVQLNRYATSGSGGGTSLVPRPHSVGDAASTVTVDDQNTTLGGTATLLLEETFNVQAGWYYTPTPEERIIMSPSSIFALTLPADAADELNMTARITFEEIGG